MWTKLQRCAPAVDEHGVTGLVHLVAHTRDGFDRVVEHDSAAWLWEHLRNAFPDAVASELMLDHLHGLVPGAGDPMARLRRVLHHYSRQFGARWDVGPATPVHTRAIARRTTRYILLNAVRGRFVDDPLEWPWSTLRDAIGATAEPWGGPLSIAEHLGLAPASLHAYVASDSSCSAIACRPPAVLGAGTPVAISLAAIAEACAAALRRHPSGVRRKGSRMRATFVALAYEVGSPRPADLADACGVSTRAVRLLRSSARPPDLRAARRCLPDARLRRWAIPTAQQLPKCGS